MTTISKEEYIKRYLSEGKDAKKKRRRPKHVKKSNIIDDDVDVRSLQADENERTLDDNLVENEATIAEFIDERPQDVIQLEKYRHDKRWRVLAGNGANSGERHDSDSDCSNQVPNFMHGSDIEDGVDRLLPAQSDQSQRRRERHDSDSDQLPKRHKRHDSDSDQSPSRRNQHDSGSDQSPKRRKRLDSDSDQSPSRRKQCKSDSDQSPPRRKQYKSDSDQSPQRRKKGHHSDSDQSPQRRRKAHHSDSDQSPQRRRKAHHSDSDQSPQRRKAHHSDSDQSPQRRRKRHKYDRSPKKRKQHGSDSDKSPRRRKHSRKSPRRSEHQKEGKSDRAKCSRWSKDDMNIDESGRAKSTLAGAKAGLSSAREMRDEALKIRERETQAFNKLDSELLGRDAKTVFRDRASGRKRNMAEEREVEKVKEAEEAKKVEKYANWGKGLKQAELQQTQLAEALHEVQKPLARYSNDTDLDALQREQEREGDPMLAYMKKKKKTQRQDGKPELPRYKGREPPVNRFNLWPGYRWDGVNRSNGFELKYFAKLTEKKVVKDMAYKWSVEDM